MEELSEQDRYRDGAIPHDLDLHIGLESIEAQISVLQVQRAELDKRYAQLQAARLAILGYSS